MFRQKYPLRESLSELRADHYFVETSHALVPSCQRRHKTPWLKSFISSGLHCRLYYAAMLLCCYAAAAVIECVVLCSLLSCPVLPVVIMPPLRHQRTAGRSALVCRGIVSTGQIASRLSCSVAFEGFVLARLRDLISRRLLNLDSCPGHGLLRCHNPSVLLSHSSKLFSLHQGNGRSGSHGASPDCKYVVNQSSGTPDIDCGTEVDDESGSVAGCSAETAGDLEEETGGVGGSVFC
jgi:hypothetical protein